MLVEIDWLDYGHKFGDRCGHQENTDDVSEQCPVFLQWLDCVHQLLKQFPCLFEFNEAFLVSGHIARFTLLPSNDGCIHCILSVSPAKIIADDILLGVK